jgi:DNA-binding MarR family transcriptional regulator
MGGIQMPSKLEDDLGFLLARTHRAMRRSLMSMLEPTGITYEQFRVLNALCEEEDVSQVDLADRVNADQTSLARMLGRMESAELVSRTVDAADSRVNRIMLTDKGRHLAEQMAPQRDRALSLAVQGLGEKEVVELKRLLNQLYENTRS